MMAGVFLLLVSGIWGYAVLENGGVVRQERMITLCALGVVGIVHQAAAWRNAAPRLAGLLRWAALSLPAYVALQLVPLPMWLLRILSPARAAATGAFSAVGPVARFAPLSVMPEATMKHFLLICGYAVLFLLVRDIGWRLSGQPWRAAAPIIIIGVFEAGLGLAQAFNGQEVTGTYVNRDHYAGLLEMTLPFAVMYPISIWRGVNRRRDFPAIPAIRMSVLLGLSSVILLGIVYSLSRMGFIAALFSLLVTGAAARLGSGKKWLLSAVILTTALVACFVFLSPDRLIARFSQIFSTQALSSESRVMLWRESLGALRAFPLFGCGMGGFESVFMRYKLSDPLVSDAYAHNDYLQLLIELGVVGFAIGAILFVCIARAAIRATTRVHDTNARCVAAACAGALSAIGLHSFVDFNLYTPANAMLLAWIAGICASLDITPPKKTGHMPLTF